MEEQTRNFKGVWVPKEIWLNKELTNLEKTFLIEIDSLENEELGCFASNQHFSDTFGVAKHNVSRVITNLKNKGYIRIEYERKGKEITHRHIFINRPPYYEKWGYSQNESRYSQNEIGVLSKLEGGYSQNCKDNNTYINNTIIDNNNIYCRAEEIIDYLNQKTGKHFKSSTPKTKSLINARIKEGFTLDDFKKVIDTKCDEWLKDNKMSIYLRPETLFGTKFEGYLNQEKKVRTTKDIQDKIDYTDFLNKGVKR